MDRRIDPGAHPRRAWPRGRPVTIELDGRGYRAFEGEPAAVALFASGARILSRSLKYHRPRTFFCLAGHCNGCVMRVDGRPNVRACREPCHEGMALASQHGYPSSDRDLLGAADWLFPSGMDHHALMTRPAVLNRVLAKVLRRLGSTARLPDVAPAALPEVVRREVDVLVVGGGPAGLAAATTAARAGAQVLLVDDDDEPGGSLLAHPAHGREAAARAAGEARTAGAELVARAAAIAHYPEDEGAPIAVATPAGLWLVRARRTVHATGAYDTSALFEDNDRPGVFSARAAGRLAVRWGVRPGERVLVLGDGDDAYAAALTEELGALGIEATALGAGGERVVRARGRGWLDGVDLEGADGRRRAVPCDALAVASRPAPASELARQQGARVELVEAAGGFAVVAAADGRTSARGVLAAGDVTGYQGPERAAEAGARAGRTAAREAGEEGA